MVSHQDKTPEKVRIKDSYRERIFGESQQLGKSYLETLYFIIDCYFAFKHGAFPFSIAVNNNGTNQLRVADSTHREQEVSQVLEDSEKSDGDLTPEASSNLDTEPIIEDSSETFTLDWDL
ncbi:hypothetical protein G7B40_024885 [Aetokthonos hydrillicola Thurmond2011]|uniref:Uncharacterized protein n=1 Tax=Aetokthonos hydrillicola Thurmond2011 TaxID=2712845 RepID=A0AAP5IDL8_9CYAN|nr:hypothetical protein [Aetokthonos hydrillicola]MBO3458502.1 hypothetical protein [Aetokthonos hydrillicola CCALA 1050]MBW4586171.1 hypothetical protein [Aetokthonos hydrillicola CCALA 1050]MDR9897778.1 hypothetical protein [Aetokthonos hydrillicola Thurmond2011]